MGFRIRGDDAEIVARSAHRPIQISNSPPTLRFGEASQRSARRACPVSAKARIIARILCGADGNDRQRGASAAVAECPLHANSDAQQNVTT